MNKILILGSTGMLGKALMGKAKQMYDKVYGLARTGTDFNLDVKNLGELESLIYQLKPDLIINCIAITQLENCENKPCEAYFINAKLVSHLINDCRKNDTRFVQVSTDHYYTGDNGKQHSEEDTVVLLNEYARTKYAAERFASLYEKSLIIRTNIIGCRDLRKAPSFGDWILKTLTKRLPLKLFSDVYHSPIHVDTFSEILFKIINVTESGLYNVASKDVISKKCFIEAVASIMDIKLDWAQIGSVRELDVIRAESSGLDVTKAESLLNINFPSARLAAECLVKEYHSDMSLHV